MSTDVGLSYAEEDPPKGPLPSPRRDGRQRSSRRRWLFVAGGVVLLSLVALGVLALPLLGVRSDAEQAKSDLTAAIKALRTDDLATAKTRVASAREHIDHATTRADGIGGDIWSAVPVAGGAVGDMRHLVAALGDATSIAQLGVDLYPSVLGGDATLIHDDTVDLATLTKVEAAVTKVGTYLSSASSELAKVSGSTPVIGGSISRARDGAQTSIAGIQHTYDKVVPIMGVLPQLLGMNSDTSYLIAVMNPAEMRYSGGATLTLAPMDFSNGHATFGDSGATTDFTDSNETISWPPVENNPFHTSGPSRLVNATFSPYWPVSGEELLRAWKATSDQDSDAMIAIDLQAVAQLFAITGPIDVPGYGKLTAGNFVQTLAGSYDRFDNAAKRKAINATIIPAFQQKLLSGGKFLQKAEVLLHAAEGRHFVIYFRDPAVQSVFAGLGLDGDLSDTAHDYIGAFTQNTNASKVDYWQQRTVASDVTLAADGSARVHLTVTIDNDTPPYTRPVADPKRGYFTRWAGQAISVFLPVDATITSAALSGAPFTPALTPIENRTFFQQAVTIEPGGTAVLDLEYTVPAAATVNAAGDLTYSLAVDPQPVVNPEALDVILHLPDGYASGALPDGWTAKGRTLMFKTDALQVSPRWAITATRANP